MNGLINSLQQHHRADSRRQSKIDMVQFADNIETR